MFTCRTPTRKTWLGIFRKAIYSCDTRLRSGKAPGFLQLCIIEIFREAQNKVV